MKNQMIVESPCNIGTRNSAKIREYIISKGGNVYLVKMGTERKIDASSRLALLSSDIQKNDVIRIISYSKDLRAESVVDFLKTLK